MELSPFWVSLGLLAEKTAKHLGEVAEMAVASVIPQERPATPRTYQQNPDEDGLRALPIDVREAAEGTKYEGEADHPFAYREEARHNLDWYGLSPRERQAEIRYIGIQLLTEVAETDPNVRYVKAVANAVLDSLASRARGSNCEHAPIWEEIDALREAVDAAASEAAEAVARGWLRERGSVPLRD